jgi:hypothetical protein
VNAAELEELRTKATTWVVGLPVEERDALAVELVMLSAVLTHTAEETYWQRTNTVLRGLLPTFAGQLLRALTTVKDVSRKAKNQ